VLRRPAAEIREGWLPGPGGAVRSPDAAAEKVAKVET
jgi:hypothetical protein